MFKKATNLLAIFTVALFSLMVSSCSDNDDNNTQREDIVGVWKHDHLKGWEKENGKIIESFDVDVLDDAYYVFEADGNFYEAENYYDTQYSAYVDGTWSYSNGKLKLTYNDGEQETINCSVDDNTMTMSSGGKEVEGAYKYEYYYELKLKRIVK